MVVEFDLLSSSCKLLSVGGYAKVVVRQCLTVTRLPMVDSLAGKNSVCKDSVLRYPVSKYINLGD